GQTCTRAKIREKAADFISITILPRCASFASSQRTMAEMPHGLAFSRRRSAGVRVSSSAWTRMCVSRFSIPPDSRGHQVAFYLDAALHAADQIGATGVHGHQAAHRFPMLGNDDSFGIEIVQQGQALFL